MVGSGVRLSGGFGRSFGGLLCGLGGSSECELAMLELGFRMVDERLRSWDSVGGLCSCGLWAGIKSDLQTTYYIVHQNSRKYSSNS